MLKKTLSLLMCAILLLSSAAFLFSCKEDEDGGEKFVEKDVYDIDLTGYSVILGVELTELVSQQALSFAREVSKLTTVDMQVTDDAIGEVIKTKDPEILIGVTTREESVKTYNEIQGHGWAVRVFEHKIAIVGTTPYLTAVALNWFERTHLNAEHVNGTTLTVQGKNLVSNLPTVPMTEKVDDVDTTFTVVYEKGKDSKDKPYEMADSVSKNLLERTGIEPQFVTADTEATAREILVGNMSRDDVKAELAKIAADEYAVTIKDNKIYLVAWSDDVLPSAYQLFQEMLFASSVFDEAGNVVSYNIPSGSTLIKKYASDWITDFPKPEAQGLYPEAAVDVNDGALQYIYAGPGATRETFVAYCETLKAAGYTPLGNADVQWEGSSFRTFVNNEKGVSLHVSHMAFTHAEEQEVVGLLNSIRIVSGSLAWGGTQVDAKYFRPQVAGVDYQDLMNSQITSNMFDYDAPDNWGLGQLITLADGSFIVIDGGRAKGTDETANMWQLMREMHKKAHGSYPTKRNPAHIRAWIITHEHGDHHNLLANFCNTFGILPEVRFDYLFENFGSKTQLRTAGGTNTIRNGLKTYQEKVKNGFEYVQVNTGQVFYFANCRLEVLATIDDMYPWRCNEQNNATTVTRTALYYGENGEDTPTTTKSLWLGDAEVLQSRVLRAMYGTFLESDHVQVAHHGNNGGSDKLVYKMVGSCEVIWYPNAVSANALKRAMSDSWSCNFSAAFLNPSCKLMIFNGSEYNAFDKWEVTLPIAASGALYDQLYDGATGELITAKGEPWPAVDVQAYIKSVKK